MDNVDHGKKSLIDTSFNTEERQQLQFHFEAGSWDTVRTLLTEKGITASPDVAEVLGELAGEEPKPETIASVLQVSAPQEQGLPTLDEIDLGASAREPK